MLVSPVSMIACYLKLGLSYISRNGGNRVDISPGSVSLIEEPEFFIPIKHNPAIHSIRQLLKELIYINISQ